MRQFGWETTWEDEQARRHAALDWPHCPICGEEMKPDEKTCSHDCKALGWMLDGKPKTDIGYYLFTIMALSCEIDVDQIASLVGRPVETATAWANRTAVRELVHKIRKRRADTRLTKQERTLLRSTAHVLGIGINTLDRLLHQLYFLKGKKRRRAQRFMKRPVRTNLAAKVGLTEDEFLRMSQFEKIFRSRRQPSTGNRRGCSWHPEKKSRSVCSVCGQAAPRHGRPYCGELHANLQRVIRSIRRRIRAGRLLETHQRFATLVLMSCGLDAAQAAEHFRLDSDLVTAWGNETFLQTAKKISTARGKSPSVFATVDQVFKWSRGTTERYLYNRVFRQDRSLATRPRAPKIPNVNRLAGYLGISSEACLQGLGADHTWEDHVKKLHEWSVQKMERVATGTLGQRGPTPDLCWRLDKTVKLAIRLGREPSGSELKKENIVLAKGVPIRAVMRKHMREVQCPRCLPAVALYFSMFSRRLRKNPEKTLGVSEEEFLTAVVKGRANFLRKTA